MNVFFSLSHGFFCYVCGWTEYINKTRYDGESEMRMNSFFCSVFMFWWMDGGYSTAKQRENRKRRRKRIMFLWRMEPSERFSKRAREKQMKHEPRAHLVAVTYADSTQIGERKKAQIMKQHFSLYIIDFFSCYRKLVAFFSFFRFCSLFLYSFCSSFFLLSSFLFDCFIPSFVLFHSMPPEKPFSICYCHSFAFSYFFFFYFCLRFFLPS